MKKGVKTSEFWLSLAALIVGAILASGLISDSNIVRALGAAQAALAQLGYTFGRAQVKRAELSANALRNRLTPEKKTVPQ